ncbi:MAG: CHRD domain-containing protein [Bacteroidota bacterium]|nr:CHRD domain-containing protein [Bacteroidota bacterium]MDP3143781.1 CHRD domain-containing protein [Bacteroidota bacterium]MDP3556964.1 CHRD domain-containing protein [Bacteroidota bacterium]
MKKITRKIMMIALTLASFSGFSSHLRSHMLLSARLDGAQQVPALTNSGTGVASLLLNSTRDTLCINMSFNGLTSAPTAMHIHSGAIGVNGGVLFDLTPFIIGNRVSATLTGTVLTSALKSSLLKGLTYINVHTTANPGGEIRGQISLESDMAFTGLIDGAQSVPAVTTSANGWAVFNVSKHQGQVRFYVVTNGLSGAITSAHLHTGAVGVNGPVAQDLATYIVGNTIVGVFTPSAGVISSLMAGNIYLNVHTTANPGGEIRAQLKMDDKIAFDAWIDGAQQTPAITTSAKGVASVKVNTTFDTLFYNVYTNGLSGAINSAHFHLGAYGISGGVAVDISSGISGNKITGIVTGTAVSTSFINSMLSGGVYLNIHTTANPGGEIRGQVYRVMREGYTFSMDGTQQVPSVSTAGRGSGMVSIDRDQDNAHYMLVTSGVTSAGIHFHKGLVGQSGGVAYDLSTIYTNNGAFGYWKSNDATPFLLSNSAQFNKDSIYINLHTTANAGGEIRGQVTRGFKCYSLLTGIESIDNLSNNSVSIFPNPSTTGNFNMSLTTNSENKISVTVYDILGKIVYSSNFTSKIGSNNININLTENFKGMYFVKLDNGDNSITKKLIID